MAMLTNKLDWHAQEMTYYFYMCSPEITRFLFSRENLPTIVRKRREVYEDSIFFF